MRSLDFIVDGLERPVALEQLFITSASSSDDGCCLRAPLSTLTTTTTIELMARPLTSAPTVFYIALTDGLYVGVSAMYRVASTVINDHELLYRLGDKPVSDSLWRWRDLKDYWHLLTLSSTKLKKRPCPRFRSSLAVFPTPDTVFTQLIKRYPSLPLPGTMVICASPFIGLPVNDRERFELTLTDPLKKQLLTHRYEMLQLD